MPSSLRGNLYVSPDRPEAKLRAAQKKSSTSALTSMELNYDPEGSWAAERTSETKNGSIPRHCFQGKSPMGPERAK